MGRPDSDWLRGNLDLLVLSVLLHGPQYGYNIAQQLRARTDDRVTLTAGTLYPLLHRLEADRLISSRWDDSTGRRRKWYELTAKGRTRVEQQARDWSAFAACLHELFRPVLTSLKKDHAPRGA
jgi:DNA-binding PadR family transcriptional regulator